MERYLVRKGGTKRRLVCTTGGGASTSKRWCGELQQVRDQAGTQNQPMAAPTSTSPVPKDQLHVNGNTDIVTKIIREAHGLNLIYYPRFIQPREATIILGQLEKELSPFFSSKSDTNVVKLFRKVYEIPRQQAGFGDSGLSYTFSGITIAASPWTPTVLKLKQAVERALEQTFNFVLVNHYRNGYDHMGEHQDNEEELTPEAPIASLSIGEEREFVFRHKDSRGRKPSRKNIDHVRLCLAHGSLLVMKHPTNRDWYHSLPARKNAHKPRINLTFRNLKN